METFVISTKANEFLVSCEITRYSGAVGLILLQKRFGRDGEKNQAGCVLNTKKCPPLSQDTSTRCSKFWVLMHEGQFWDLLPHFNGILTLRLKASPYLHVHWCAINKEQHNVFLLNIVIENFDKHSCTFQFLLESYKTGGNLT